MYNKRLKLSELLSCSINHGSEISSFASVKVFIYHIPEFVKICFCCKVNYSGVLSVKIFEKNVVTFHQLLSKAQ